MVAASYRIATIGGIPIRIHVSFLLVLPLVAFGFERAMGEATRLAGVDARTLGSPIVWGIGIALALFACVLVHELAHSLFAVWRGGRVEDITLLMIGGVSRITRPPRGHGNEALMALAGPLASLILGAGFLFLHEVGGVLSAAPAILFGTFYLGYLNVFLGLFNLLPAFPMDGGRVLRAVLAIPLGASRATAIAAFMGRAFAVLFVLAGLLGGNIVLVLIGFVVWSGAGAERRQSRIVASFEGVVARDVMTPAPEPVDAGAPLAFAAERMLAEREPVLAVTDAGALAGIVTVDDVRRVPPERRVTETVRQAVPLRVPPPITPDSDVSTALSGFAEGFAALPVMEGGRVVGLLTPEALVRARELRALGDPPRRWHWREREV